ncbi:hypothetical protein M758_6G077000 [Ceratodon purpureus]|uniref:Uncharacterized protein n=1 Tax=Ceratodon purpureus TaxID=3225 RepID=A0A8T0HIF3_CERPU|nr:hypothetical protein KC19_6G081500 [Ceratodon purpureus]KAG0613101.1 hypothetical protein M758_6G077000 [Ceratodon purpureus]
MLCHWVISARFWTLSPLPLSACVCSCAENLLNTGWIVAKVWELCYVNTYN